METVPNKKDKILKITLLATLILVAGVLIYATVSYAYWQKEHELEKENLLSSGCFSLRDCVFASILARISAALP